MTARLLVFAALAALSAVAGAREFTLRTVKFSDTELSATVLELPRGAFSGRVIATSRVAASRGIVDPTVEAVGPVLGDELRGGDYVLLSGGFNQQDPFVPAGLLVENSRNLSPLSLAKKSVAPGKVAYRLSGILCVDALSSFHIVSVEEYLRAPPTCTSAIQAGPLVVERTQQQAILTSTGASADRLVACESDNVFAFYYFANATLANVERALRPKCDVALNLAGSVQASISVWRASRPRQSAGTLSTPLPSMLLVR